MPYVNNIKEDGVTYDIQAKALDPTLDATILRKSELVNGFTQTTPGVNALDAAAGKSLNDSLSNYATKTNLANFETEVASDYVANNDALVKSAVNFYSGNRRFGIRGVGVATASNEILFPFRPFAIYQGGGTPTVTVHSVSVTGLTGVTGSVDTNRSDRYCVTISITGASVTVGRSYFCFADITV